MRNKFRWAALATGLVMGLTGFILWRTLSSGSAHNATRKVLFYQDSMHPWIKSDSPGKCTICSMDLTAIYEGQKGFGANDDIVLLSSNSITVLNVQTEEVKRQALSQILRVAGTLEPNESRKTIFSAPDAGRILSLAVESVGMEVAEKQKLMTFYSPDWALKRQYSFRFGARGTNKLEADAFSVDLDAPHCGTVVERTAYNGQYVLEGEKLLTIIDSSVLWFRFDAYENQLPMLEEGQSIKVTVPAVPNRVFTAKIAVIEPVLNEATRTVKVRADIQNPQVQVNGQKKWLLHYGMYAQGQIQADQPEVLAVPRSAVLFPGDSAHVFVDSGNGAYERRLVKLGRHNDRLWEVLSGLNEGERVVTSGNVLMDAQAQFNHTGKLDNDADDARTGDMTEQENPKEGAVEQGATHKQDTNNDAMPNHDKNELDGSVSEESSPAEISISEMPAQEPPVTQVKVDPVSNSFLLAAHELSRSLAKDTTPTFNSLLSISNTVMALQASLPSGHPRNLLVKRLVSASNFKQTGDLEEARAQFLPFSSAVVEFARALKKEDPAFSGLKIYYCPMAPKPGLWMQLQGPLQNPFFGSQMLKCGKEVQ